VFASESPSYSYNLIRLGELQNHAQLCVGGCNC